jgi:hypothetical protein
MEKNNQQVSQKLTLSIKTKVAAWWMIIAGSAVLLFFIVVMVLIGIISSGLGGGGRIFSRSGNIIWNAFLLLFLINLLFGVGILKRKKWAWWGSIIILSIPIFFIIIFLIFLIILVASGGLKADGKVVTFTSGSFIVPFLFLLLIGIIFGSPFIRLLLDRKNFWKIAT